MDVIKQNRSIILIAGIAVVAVVVVVAAMFLTNQPTAAAEVVARYADIPQSRLPDGGFVLGNPEAPITLIEFGDFACPHCQDYFVQTKQFIEEFVVPGKAKFEYRLFVSGADPTYGPYTARLAECAAILREGAFWPAHDILFELGRTRGRFNQQTARTLAESLDLNYSELLSCAEKASQVDKDVQLGASLNVQSTPTLMIRYGDSAPQFITVGSEVYNRGPVPYGILKLVFESAQ
ncbi:MAG TPA: thioredoxin domain-containing protein [Spirillospora sp.]|nr:thioredoxin domain-containing protein [Spirillospora sp.]